MANANLFISYSHEDELYLKELRKHVNKDYCPNLTIWDDCAIELGDRFDENIKKNLNNADIILLFISIDFLSSEYIQNVELPAALEKEKNGTCRIIPIFIRPCQLGKYKEISALEGIPKNGQSLSTINDRDTQYVQLAAEINEIVRKISLKSNSIDDKQLGVNEKPPGDEMDFDLSGAITSIHTSLFPDELIDDIDKYKRVLDCYPIIIAGLLREMFGDYKLKQENPEYQYNLLNNSDFFYNFYNQIVSFISFIIIKDLRDSNKSLPDDRNLFNSWKTQEQNRKLKINLITHACEKYENLFIAELKNTESFLQTIKVMEGYIDSGNNVTNLRSFRDLLFRLIEDLSFLKKYDLLAVRFISVRKSFYEKVVFKHEISRLYGPDPSVYSYKYLDLGEFVSVDAFLYNGVILTEKISSTNQLNNIIKCNNFLNLWPFIIDGHTNQNDSKAIPQLCIFENVTDINNKKNYNYRLVQYKKERESRRCVEYRTLSSFPGVEEWNDYMNERKIEIN